LASRLAHRQERDKRRREQRFQAYIDVGEFLEWTATLTASFTDEFGSSLTHPKLVHRDLLTARINLLAVKPVQEAWAELVKAFDAVILEGQENSRMGRADQPYLDADNPYVITLISTIDKLRTELRRALEKS